MARNHREERQQRRWLEDARKHLARGDLEATLPALLRLPPPLREEVLSRCASLFRQAVREQHGRGAWGTLSTLAARADAEPGLVEQGGEALEAQATYWPLVWAAGRAREWARARRLWQPLAAVARERAPHLAAALEAWLFSEGAPSPDVVAPVLGSLAAWDARLGVEQVRPRATLPPPRSLEQVEEAVLALCAVEPFAAFASRVEAWAREALPEVARAIWELAGQLAARELWLRAAEGKERAALSEPALLLARAVREGGAAVPLAAPTLQALRLVATSLPREGLSRAEEAEPWCALAHAAALYLETREWVVRAVAGFRFSGPALPRALRLYEALLALAPDGVLWARAFLAWCEHEPESFSAPTWLQEGLRQVSTTQVPALVDWLKAATSSERKELIEGIASTCAPALVESWVEACWEGADEALRYALSDAVAILLDRSRMKNSGRKLEQVLRGASTEREIFELLDRVEGMLEQAQEAMKLSGDGLRTWHRFASRVLPYRVDFLEVAVRQASSDAAAWDAATRYLEAHPGDVAYVETLRTMELSGRKELPGRVLAQWLERRANDVQALAEAVVTAERMSTPCKHLHRVMGAFLLAQEAHKPSTLSEAVRQARALSRAHEVRLRKPKAPRSKKKKKEA